MKKISGRIVISFIILIISTTTNAVQSPDDRNYNTAWQTHMEQLKNRKNLNIPQYAQCFEKSAAEFGIPLGLLVAVARGESFFNPKAQSNKSCYGIMQIQWPGTAKDLGIDNLNKLYDPCTNIHAGAKYLKQLLDRYKGNIHFALAAYNYGPGRIGTNPSALSIPQGARWYSGYIYHHMEKVLAIRPSMQSAQESNQKQPIDAPLITGGRKAQIFVFNKPYRAKALYESFQKKIPELEFEWFRIAPGRFEVSVLYNTKSQLSEARNILKAHGVTLIERPRAD